MAGDKRVAGDFFSLAGKELRTVVGKIKMSCKHLVYGTERQACRCTAECMCCPVGVAERSI